MPEQGTRRRPIHLLRESVARQIAAGEVIERPQSLVRELIDNAIDAGATGISVWIEAGGVGLVRVVDNGAGMSAADLSLCCRPHATSKITDAADLDHITSLGFRGEALASMAACSRLVIVSRTSDDAAAHRLQISAGKAEPLEETHGDVGTIVEVADLFYTLPARRRFLRAASAETAQCRSMFLEKALPFPEVEFRLFVDGKLKDYLPRVADLASRASAAYPNVAAPNLLYLVESKDEGFSFRAVVADPQVHRTDRRYIYVIVNGRRISEFGLLQAIEHAYADHVPGGTHPVAFLFVTVEPSLVDFNIHPAKREARFRNLPAIHHSVVTALRSSLARFDLRRDRGPDAGADTSASTFLHLPFESSRRLRSDAESAEKAAQPGHPPTTPQPVTGAYPARGWELGEIARDLTPVPVAPAVGHDGFRYLGQVFRLFLVASAGERLYIIDQHAAHERVLFEFYRGRKLAAQRLLVPVAFEVNDDEADYVRRVQTELRAMGVELSEDHPGSWRIESVPDVFRGMEDDLVAFILERGTDERTLQQELFATMSCRAAVKEGDALDDLTAQELIEKTFELRNAHCPHGRPIWYELSREDLYRFVGRL